MEDPIAGRRVIRQPRCEPGWYLGQGMEVRAMSSETWQEIFGLLTLLPWIGFVVAVVLFKVLEVRDDARAAQASERARMPRSGKRVEHGPSTNP